MLKKNIFCAVVTLLIGAGWMLPRQASTISLNLTGTAFGIAINGDVPKANNLTAEVAGQVTDLGGNPIPTIPDVYNSNTGSTLFTWVEYNGTGTVLQYMQASASKELRGRFLFTRG